MGKVKRTLSHLLFGNHFENEYLCLDESLFDSDLQYYLDAGNGEELLNVTKNNLLLGYKPMLIGIAQENLNLPSGNIVRLICKYNLTVVATLEMQVLDTFKKLSKDFLLLKGVWAEQRMQSSLYKFTNRIREKVKSKPVGNIDLDINLYDQVRVGYSLPRQIALGIIKVGEAYNAFPTDLHGRINSNYYAESLRTENLAWSQLKATGQMVIVSMLPQSYKMVYSMGYRHNRQPSGIKGLHLSDSLKSKEFGYCLPELHNGYVELALEDSCEIGIHQLNYLKIVNEEAGKDARRLAHVHSLVANWRRKAGIQDHFLIR